MHTFNYQCKMIIFYQTAFQGNLCLKIILVRLEVIIGFFFAQFRNLSNHTCKRKLSLCDQAAQCRINEHIEKQITISVQQRQIFWLILFFHIYEGLCFVRRNMRKVVRIACTVRTNIWCKFHGRLHAHVTRRHFQRSTLLTTSLLYRTQLHSKTQTERRPHFCWCKLLI